MAPGILINISFVMASGLTALIFILERRDGMFERQLVSGVESTQILIAHAGIRIITMFAQSVVVLVIILIWLELPSRGSLFWIFLMLLLQNCAGMTYGLVVSAICRQENTASIILSATVTTNLILCGMIWPIEAMPYWIRWLSYGMPSTLPTEAIRSLMNRGWGISHQRVWSGFAATIIWLFVFSVGAARLFKIKR